MSFTRVANGADFSPCIISKARYKLGLKNIAPNNHKKCSRIYWNEACTVVGNYYGLPYETINLAIAAFNDL